MKKPDVVQERVIGETLENLKAGGAALVVAPPGFGKTGTLLTVGSEHLKETPDGKVLFLTHRRKLLDQVTDADVPEWLGVPVGRISAEGDGGIDQVPRIVIGMVQTAANNLDGLEKYSLAIVDEAHHTLDGDAGNDPTGDYDAVLSRLEEMNPDLQVCGGSATPFRGDGLEMDRRLKDAPESVVTYAEAIAAGRILPPETVRLDYRLKTGKTVRETVDKLIAEGGIEKVAREIGQILLEQRPDDFADRVARDLKAGGAKRKTICFTDTVEEARNLAKACQAQGLAVCMVASEMGDKHNAKAFSDYESGASDILVNCKMIGEGYNVPETERVAVLNRSTVRTWYAQMIGRGMRPDGSHDKTCVLDYGATSYVWGRMEDQIFLQSATRALAGGKDADGRLDALRRLLVPCGRDTGVAIFPSAGRTWFVTSDGDKDGYVVYQRERRVGRDSVNRSSMRVLKKIDSPGGRARWSLDEIAGMMSAEMKEHVGWHAVQMGRQVPVKGADGVLSTVSGWKLTARADFVESKDALERFLMRKLERESPVESRSPVAGGDVEEPLLDDVVRRLRPMLDAKDGAQSLETALNTMIDGAGSIEDRKRGVLAVAGLCAKLVASQLEGHDRQRCMGFHASVDGGKAVQFVKGLGGRDIDARLEKAADLFFDVGETLGDRGRPFISRFAESVAAGCEKAHGMQARGKISMHAGVSLEMA